MADYKAVIRPLTRLIVGATDFKMPLCDTCQAKDCENPIEIRQVAVPGGIRKMKCWIRGPSVNIVVKCDGFYEPGKPGRPRK
jgi:hypothetical protein